MIIPQNGFRHHLCSLDTYLKLPKQHNIQQIALVPQAPLVYNTAIEFWYNILKHQGSFSEDISDLILLFSGIFPWLMATVSVVTSCLVTMNSTVAVCACLTNYFVQVVFRTTTGWHVRWTKQFIIAITTKLYNCSYMENEFDHNCTCIIE